MIKRVVLLSVFALTVLSSNVGLYLIEIEGQPGGFHSFRQAGEGEGYLHISSTFMKVSIMGKEAQARFNSRTKLTSDFYPVEYRLDLISNQMNQSIDAFFAADTVGFVISSGDDSLTSSVYLDEATMLYDNNIFDLIRILLKKADWEKGKPRTVNIYVPQTSMKGTAEIIPGGSMEYRGEMAQRVKLNILGMEMNGVVDPTHEKLLRMESPLQGITFIRMDELDTIAVKEQAFIPVTVMESSYYIPSAPVLNPGIVNGLKVEGLITVDKRGDGISLDGENQEFEGEMGDTIGGVFTINRMDYEGLKGDRFPPKKVDKSLSRWLMATEDFPKGDSYLDSIAHAMTAGAKNTMDAALAIQFFMVESISYASNDYPPRQVFDLGMGNAISQARLMVTLLRTLGIPSRIAGGLYFTGGVFASHHWVEANLKDMWIPFDPTAGEKDGFSPLHIKIFTGFGQVGAPPSGIEDSEGLIQDGKLNIEISQE